ncbi:MAG: translocation/assembly module TamB domain-containing protein [Gemmatimonadota bacterium]
MGRRRHVAFASAIAILLMGTVLVVVLVAFTRSVRGREFIRAQTERTLASVFKGKIHVGALSGNFLTDLTIDTLEIREPNDSLFLATGPVHVTFDPRDIVDGVIFLRSLDVQRPFLRLQRRNDAWNYNAIFPRGPKSPSGARRGFGSRVTLSNVRVRGGEVRMALPWAPADSLRGVRRDSAITHALRDTLGGVRRIGPDEYEKEWKWSGIAAQLSHAHIADPDTGGQHFEVARLDLLERYPPFNVRNARGTFQRRGDSLWVDVPRFDLPGSTGNAKGKVVWGSKLPMRYDIRIHSDSVSLADIAWVYETLPTTGGGRMDLHIRSERNPRVVDYVLQNMDIRTTGSRLRGSMTFGIGAPVLILKDLALEALPVDFRLIEQFGGEPLPMPWRGTISGTVRARGGPVNRWQLDEARFTFADGNVPGAITRGTARGQLDILFPAFTVFRGVTVDLAQLDLRTLQALDPEFPRLNGYVAGHAVLDSSWLDVRFKDGDFTHHDGDAPVSHFKGSGRVTSGDEFMTYDLALVALPLSMTSLARSFPALPVRGEFSGPLRVKGTPENLFLNADLVGDAGRVEVDGTFDVSAPGYRATARGRATGLDLRRLLGRDDVPSTTIALRWSSDVSGDSLADLRGGAELHMERSLVDSVRIYGGDASLRFLSGTMLVDSLTLESAAFSVAARGSLSLAPGRAGDSVSFRVVLDSLGGFRRALAKSVTMADSGAARDTSALEGTLRIDGAVLGSWPALRVNAVARGTDIRVGSTFAKDIDANARLSFPLDSLRGAVHARVEGLTVGGVRLNNVDATADIPMPGHVVTELKAELSNGPVATARAEVAWSRDTTTVRLDRFRLAMADNDWALLSPANISRAGAAWTVDSLVILGRTAGRIALRGSLPDQLEMAAAFDATDVPLADIGELVQAKSPLSGRAWLSARVSGTRDAPLMALDAAVRDALVAGVHMEHAAASGRYADRRVEATVSAMRKTVTALRADATIPVDLRFRSVPRRLLADAPLRANIRSDSAGVALLELLTTEVTKARGTLALEASISGTVNRPLVNGSLRVTNGGFDLPVLGTSWHDVEADIGFHGDSIAVRNVTVRSGDARGGQTTLSGWLGFRDMDDPRFDLRLIAQNFNVINKARVADLDLSGALRVAGATSGSALTGALQVDRGTVFIPDIFTKELISLDDPELRNIVDTVALADHGILPRAPSRVVENLRISDVPVTMGGDVKIRSSEANITLGGRVRITAARVRRGRDAGRYQLALSGTLQTVRGSYRLNAGPVQRTFDVEGGEIRFRGDPDPNLAEMDIRALHTVRTFSQSTAQRDVRVRVNIGGTLGSPRASFSTPDSSRVSDSDILSYLVTGGPSNEILGRSGGDVSTTAYRVALSSLGSVIGSKWSGGLCDDAQFSTASLDQYNRGIKDVGSSLLSGSRFNCAKQLGERVFFRIDAGLCSIGQLMGQGGSSSLFDALGFKFDYRFNHGITTSAGMDPSTNAALCTRDAVVRGFAPTPRQVGLDLIRAWQF